MSMRIIPIAVDTGFHTPLSDSSLLLLVETSRFYFRHGHHAMKVQLFLVAFLGTLSCCCFPGAVSREVIDEKNEIQDNIRNLFNSILKKDVQEAGAYRDILEQEAIRERQAFDRAKKEVQIEHGRNVRKQKDFYNKNRETDDSRAIKFKREIENNAETDTTRHPNSTYAPPNSMQTLYEAAERRDLEAVKHYFERQEVPPNIMKGVAYIAADNDDLTLLQYVLDKNTSIARKEGDYDYSVFRRAVARDSLEVVKYLVEKHDADIFHWLEEDEFGPTVVDLAIQGKRISILEYFLDDRNIDVNAPVSWSGWNILFSAVDAGLEDRILRHIVENKNANLTALDSNGENVLYRAAGRHNLNFMKYVLDERMAAIDVNSGNARRETLIKQIVAGGWKPNPNTIPLLEYLVNQKAADVNIADDDGNTPLHCVQSEQMCRFLVEHGASVKQKNKKGERPVHTVISSVQSSENSLAILEYLVKHGANLNVKNADGETPLILATTISNGNSDGQFKICRFLIDKGADLNLADNSGYTPLFFTVAGQIAKGRHISGTDHRLLNYYLLHGAVVNFVTTTDSDSALHLAVRYSTPEVCDILYRAGINMNRPNKMGETPLHVAVELSKMEVIKYLVEDRGVNLDAPTFTDGRTPLHRAAANNDYEVCRYLIENGVQSRMEDKEGKTAIQIATDKRLLDYMKKTIPPDDDD